MMRIQLTKESWIKFQFKVKQYVNRVPRILLVDYLRWVSLSLLLIAFVVLVYLVIVLLFVTPAVEETNVEPEKKLRVEVIDELEFWLEERQAEGDRNVLEPGRTYFGS